MKYFLLVILFASKLSFACKIEFYPTIVISSESPTILPKYNDCSANLTAELLEQIQGANGKINIQRRALTIDDTQNPKIIPEVLNVIQLKSLIQKKINRKDLIITDAKFIGTSDTIQIGKFDKFYIEDHAIQRAGNYTLKFVFKASQRPIRNIWIKLKTKQKIHVYRYTKHLAPQESLKPEFFQKEQILVEKPKEYHHSLKNIQFYQTTSHRSAGDFLKPHHISPLQLIKPMQHVDLQLKSNGINLNIKAMALQSGVIGQEIRLQNSKTKKHITAKVIDKNKVVLEL